MLVWVHAITEVDSVVMNPLAPERFLGLVRQLGLQPGQRVLDIGAGRGGPARLLAAEFGCEVTAVEPYDGFIEVGRRRAEAAGVGHLVDYVQTTGADADFEPESFDAAMCLGASWAFGGLEGTLDALAATVRDEGHVLAGEPYKQTGEDGVVRPAEGWTLAEIVESFEARGLAVMWMVRSSTQEWDEYTSVHARDLLAWMDANPGHPDFEEVRGWRREQARKLGEPYMGWAILAGRKTTKA